MTDENQTDAGSQKVEQASDIKQETIKTDVFGIELELPIETAKALISKRDERTSVFRDLNEKVKKYESDLSETKKRLDMAEKVKQGAFEEAEKIANQKLEEKVSKYKTKVVDGEIKAALMGNPEFIGHEALPDVMALIKSNNKFELTEDDNIKSGEFTVKEIVDNFLKEKSIYRKAAKGAAASSARPAPVATPKQPASLAKGLEKFIKG